jgi:hypothetical protein
MLFALADYLAYRRRSGRYSREKSRSPMAFGFDFELPPKAIAALRPGDAIFLLTFDSWLSWAVMYMTNSEVSHAAIYLGDGLISHATLGGVVKEPVRSLYGRSCRLLPCLIGASDEQRANLHSVVASQLGQPYGWGIVLLKALRIMSARLWPLFRWTFVLDLAVLTIVADIAAFALSGRVIGFSAIVLLYLLVILWGGTAWRRHGYRREDITPDMLLWNLHQMGGQIVMDAYEMSQLIAKAAERKKDASTPPS